MLQVILAHFIRENYCFDIKKKRFFEGRESGRNPLDPLHAQLDRWNPGAISAVLPAGHALRGHGR